MMSRTGFALVDQTMDVRPHCAQGAVGPTRSVNFARGVGSKAPSYLGSV